MLRSIAVLTSLAAAGAAVGQNTNIIRTDNVQNTLQLNFKARSFVCAHPSLVWLVFPFEATPDYNYGYSQTCPPIGGQAPIVGNAIANRIFFRNANVDMSFLGLAGNHAFQKSRAVVAALGGPVGFCATYNSSGITQREITFATAPTAALSGPTANLSATLSTTRLGPFSPARYQVTGFYIDPNGINTVNLLTPVGGVTFNTRLDVAPDTFTMPVARLNVPRARLMQQPKVITSAFFKAFYELQLQ